MGRHTALLPEALTPPSLFSISVASSLPTQLDSNGGPPPLPLHLRQTDCVPRPQLSSLLDSYLNKEEKFRELLTEHGSLVRGGREGGREGGRKDCLSPINVERS